MALNRPILNSPSDVLPIYKENCKIIHNHLEDVWEVMENGRDARKLKLIRYEGAFQNWLPFMCLWQKTMIHLLRKKSEPSHSFCHIAEPELRENLVNHITCRSDQYFNRVLTWYSFEGGDVITWDKLVNGSSFCTLS